MKFLFFIALLALVSCGKDSGGGSTSGGDSGEARAGEQTSQTDYEVPDSYTQPVDLLNVTLDEPVQILGDHILFSRSNSKKDVGSRITCSLSVSAGQSLTYRLTGDSLELDLADGTTITFKRGGTFGEGITGTWLWTGQKDGMRMTKRYTFLNNRMILNQDCEA